ncbi:MAG: DarT1-associated NADAR antitoxin family protein [Schaalia odontolytica]
MARRLVFVPDSESPYVSELSVDCEYLPGSSIQQKQRSIASLHASYVAMFPSLRVLEVSSKSARDLGAQLSAFNVMITHPGRGSYSVECAFQASKVFAHGGPFVDLFDVSSRAAKTDRRLRESGKLVGFKYFAHEFPLEPKTYFYDWLYASALCRDDKLVEQVMMFDAFTDIEHNPERSINCQARTVAKVVGLARAGLLEDALQSPRAFLELGYQ